MEKGRENAGNREFVVLDVRRWLEEGLPAAR